MPEAEIMNDRSHGDVACGHIRYFLNPAFDILKFVYFFTAVKSILQLENENIPLPQTEYHIIIHWGDRRILRMYLDVLESERVTVLVYKSTKNAESN